MNGFRLLIRNLVRPVSVKIANSRKVHKLKKALRLVNKLETRYQPHPLEYEFADFQFGKILKDIQESLLEIVLLMDTYKVEPDYNKFLFVLVKQIKTLCTDCLAMCKSKNSPLPIQTHVQMWSNNQIRFLFISYELNHIKFNEVTTKCSLIGKNALQFWFTHFGSNIVVKINELVDLMICDQQQFLTSRQKKILIENLNYSGSGYISMFGFYVFCELFGEWWDILYKWKILCLYHSGFVGLMTKLDIHFHLIRYISTPGVYIFTPCLSRVGKWVITYVSSSNKIITTRLYNRNIVHALLQGQNSNILLYPDNHPTNPEINKLLVTTSYSDVCRVTTEDSKIYEENDSKLELCEICYLYVKDSSIEPCRHHICHRCIAKWNLRNRNSCPFCRAEIHSIKVLRFSYVDRFNSSLEVSTVSEFVPMLVNTTSTTALSSQSQLSTNILEHSTTTINPAETNRSTSYSSIGTQIRPIEHFVNHI